MRAWYARMPKPVPDGARQKRARSISALVSWPRGSAFEAAAAPPVPAAVAAVADGMSVGSSRKPSALRWRRHTSYRRPKA